MKLEYRDLSRSNTERQPLPFARRFGLLDFIAGSLTIFVVSVYLILPPQIERGVDFVVYDAKSNSYASLRCIQERTTKNRFTQTRDLPELLSSVRVVSHADLGRLGRPQPDSACYAARGFTETVTRWEYFFGWLTKAVS
jgi:hypothetical protein